MTRSAFLVAVLVVTAVAAGYCQQISFQTGSVELDTNLANLNVEAKADLPGFTAQLSVSFDVPEGKIVSLMTDVLLEPAEVYLALEIGKLVEKPVDDVVAVYRENRDRGWGVVAREMGIKPGSAEFHELKMKASPGKAKVKKGRIKSEW